MGSRVGLSRSSVANFQRLLELPGKTLDLLRTGHLGMGHGRALLGLKDKTIINRIAMRAVKTGLSVRQLEEKVRRINNVHEKTPNRVHEIEAVETRNLQDTMQRILKTKVRIKGKGKTGKIEISYHSLEELDRILILIKSGAESSKGKS
jgi:ParB family chromosome partitioning protein